MGCCIESIKTTHWSFFFSGLFHQNRKLSQIDIESMQNDLGLIPDRSHVDPTSTNKQPKIVLKSYKTIDSIAYSMDCSMESMESPWHPWIPWIPWIPWTEWNPWIPWTPWNPRTPWNPWNPWNLTLSYDHGCSITFHQVPTFAQKKRL